MKHKVLAVDALYGPEMQAPAWSLRMLRSWSGRSRSQQWMKPPHVAAHRIRRC